MSNVKLIEVKYEYIDCTIFNGFIDIHYKSISEERVIKRNVIISLENVLIESFEDNSTPPKKWFNLSYKLGKHDRSFLITREDFYTIFVKLKERQD